MELKRHSNYNNVVSQAFEGGGGGGGGGEAKVRKIKEKRRGNLTFASPLQTPATLATMLSIAKRFLFEINYFYNLAMPGALC